MRSKRLSNDEQFRLIMESRRSGLPDYQWCQMNDINPGTFYNWVSRLRKCGMTIPMTSDQDKKTPAPLQEVVKVNLIPDSASVPAPMQLEQNTCIVTDLANRELPTVEITNELKYKALQNIAGGEFMNAEDFNNPLEKLSVGATVVYSSEANKAAEKKLVNKYISKIIKNDTVYCIGGKAYLVRPKEYSTGDIKNMVYKLDTFKSVDDEKSKILYDEGWWKYEVSFDYSKKSVVATDELKIMADYDVKTGEFVERDEYKMLGTAEQRIRKSLNKCVESYTDDADGTMTYNSLGLDKTEVKKYCETGDDTNCKTFKIMKNADGEPAFIVNTSEKYGFTETNLGYIQQAVDRYNEIDPTIIDTITNRYGLTCVSYDIGGGQLAGVFDGNTGWSASYELEMFRNVVVINEHNKGLVNSPDSAYSRIFFDYNLFVESRACYSRQMDGQGKEGFYNKPGIDNEEADKYAKFIPMCLEWLDKKILTRKEYDNWMVDAESTLMLYDPSYVRQWTIIPITDADFIPEK